jgi:hypothetical protein
MSSTPMKPWNSPASLRSGAAIILFRAKIWGAARQSTVVGGGLVVVVVPAAHGASGLCIMVIRMQGRKACMSNHSKAPRSTRLAVVVVVGKWATHA